MAYSACTAALAANIAPNCDTPLVGGLTGRAVGISLSPAPTLTRSAQNNRIISDITLPEGEKTFAIVNFGEQPFNGSASSSSVYSPIMMGSGFRFGGWGLALEASAEPGHALHVGHNPEAEDKRQEREDNHVVPMAAQAAHVGRTDEFVEHEHGIVRHEEDHRVLTDVVDQRDARCVEREQQA